MNSLYKMCKSIDSKLDNLTTKVEELEHKLESIHTKIIHTKTIHSSLDKTEEKSSKSTSKVSIRTKKNKKTIASPSKISVPDTEKSGSITFKMYVDKTIVTGDTYDKKKFIKNYKGSWSPEHKGWIVYNTQNIKELKSILRKMSKQFSLIKYEYKLDNSDTSNNVSKHDITPEYAFIADE
tara:strand:- start:610 stop:1149 length:540 start_codon:yes stop_codon:yes gene_type:complete